MRMIVGVILASGLAAFLGIIIEDRSLPSLVHFVVHFVLWTFFTGAVVLPTTLAVSRTRANLGWLAMPGLGLLLLIYLANVLGADGYEIRRHMGVTLVVEGNVTVSGHIYFLAVGIAYGVIAFLVALLLRQIAAREL
jgi:hypothetical protein